MTRYCIACGSALAEGARFCGECGAAVVAATGMQAPVEPEPVIDAASPPSAVEAAPPADSFAPPQPPVDEVAYAAPVAEQADWPEPVTDDVKPSVPNWFLIGGGIAILVLLLLFYLFFIRDVAGENPALPAPKAAEGAKSEEVETKAFFTVTNANIRDRPTAQGSEIMGKLTRGSAVSGTIVNGEDETSEWLELEDGKGFVGLVNLSESKPPQIAKALGDKNWTTDKPLEIWSQPDPSATLIDRVPAGTVLTLFGLTTNDYIEIKLRKGGVGYLAGGAKLLETAVPASKPVTISFNPATCNFGGELESEFEKLSKRVRDTYSKAEKTEYPTEAEREKALQALEGKSAFLKMERSFNGLTVTGIAQHYESQSVYFAEPSAQVIAAFRSAGYPVSKDGKFPSQELYASIEPSAADGRAYGKAELGCGV
jgi:uncharacterized protein YgiM (DUF1202 family)